MKMRIHKNKSHIGFPTKSKANQVNSNHSIQKSKQENGKHSMQSSTSNVVLIRKVPTKKVSSQNQKAIDNEISKVEMKINQTTEDSLNKDSRCQFQRETDNFTMINHLRGEEHINQIININIYNNMNMNETIKTCSERNPNTQREDSFIQNISIGDAKQVQINKNSYHNTTLTMQQDNTNNINDIDIIEAIDVVYKDSDKKSGKRSNSINKKEKKGKGDGKEEQSGNNSINNDINNIAKEQSEQQDKKKFIIDNDNNLKLYKKKVIKYTMIGVGIGLILTIICIFVYIFNKTN